MDWKIINITLKNTLPEVSKDCCNLIFYVKKTNKLYLGFYDGTSFYAYSGKTSDFAWTMKLVGVFEPGDVTAFIVVNEINQKDFKDVVLYGVFRERHSRSPELIDIPLLQIWFHREFYGVFG